MNAQNETRVCSQPPSDCPCFVALGASNLTRGFRVVASLARAAASYSRRGVGFSSICPATEAVPAAFLGGWAAKVPLWPIEFLRCEIQEP